MTHTCARCAKTADTLTPIEDGAQPVTGDIGLCLYCGYITTLQNDGGVVTHKEAALNDIIREVAFGSLPLESFGLIVRQSAIIYAKYHLKMHGDL